MLSQITFAAHMVTFSRRGWRSSHARLSAFIGILQSLFNL